MASYQNTNESPPESKLNEVKFKLQKALGKNFQIYQKHLRSWVLEQKPLYGLELDLDSLFQGDSSLTQLHNSYVGELIKAAWRIGLPKSQNQTLPSSIPTTIEHSSTTNELDQTNQQHYSQPQPIITNQRKRKNAPQPKLNTTTRTQYKKPPTAAAIRRQQLNEAKAKAKQIPERELTLYEVLVENVSLKRKIDEVDSSENDDSSNEEEDCAFCDDKENNDEIEHDEEEIAPEEVENDDNGENVDDVEEQVEDQPDETEKEEELSDGENGDGDGDNVENVDSSPEVEPMIESSDSSDNDDEDPDFPMQDSTIATFGTPFRYLEDMIDSSRSRKGCLEIIPNVTHISKYLSRSIEKEPHLENYFSPRKGPDQPYLTTNASLHGKFLHKIWQYGLINIQTSAMDLIILASQKHVQDIIKEMIKRRKSFKVGKDGAEGFGEEVPNPYLLHRPNKGRLDIKGPQATELDKVILMQTPGYISKEEEEERRAAYELSRNFRGGHQSKYETKLGPLELYNVIQFPSSACGRLVRKLDEKVSHERTAHKPLIPPQTALTPEVNRYLIPSSKVRLRLSEMLLAKIKGYNQSLKDEDEKNNNDKAWDGNQSCGTSTSTTQELPEEDCDELEDEQGELFPICSY